MFFEGARLRIFAEEDGKIRILPTSAHHLTNAIGHKLRFLAVIGRCKIPDLGATQVVGPKGLFAALPHEFDDVVRRIKNHLRRTIILLKFHNFGTWEVLFKSQNVGNRCASPAVDRLIVVANHGQIVVIAREMAQQLVLCRVGILKLIHHHIAPLHAVALSDIGVFSKDLQHAQNEVAKVHTIRRSKRGLIGLVEFDILLGIAVVCALVRLKWGKTIVLEGLNNTHETSGFGTIRTAILFLHDTFCQRNLIAVVIDHKVGAKPQFFGVTPKQPCTQRVKRGNRNTV